MNTDDFVLTEIGAVPRGWEVKTLGEVAEVDMDNLRSNTDPNLEIRYISLEDVDEGGLLSYSEMRFGEAPVRARRKAQKGDLLFSTVRPNLKSHLFFAEKADNYICSTGFALLRCKKGIDPKWVYLHFFGSIVNRQVNNMIAGSNYPAINSSDVKSILIPLPPLAEQTAIAAALTAADEHLRSLERLIEKKKLLKLGALQALLRPGVGWERRRLGECLNRKPDYGINAAATKLNDDLPTYLRITDIGDDGRFIAENRASVDHPLSDNYFLNKGDVVFARTGASVGKSYFFDGSDGELVFAGFLIRISVNPEIIDPAFFRLYVQTKTFWRWVSANSMRSGQPGLNSRQFQDFEIGLPPTLAVQTRIAQTLTDMDAEIAALEAQAEKCRRVKTGMMQALLTGRVRLKG